MRGSADLEARGTRSSIERNPKLWGGTRYEDPPYVALALVSGALCDSGNVVPYEIGYGDAVREITGQRDQAIAALERIRAILDAGPHAYDDRKIKDELAAVLGPFAYRVRKPCP